ncbi:MAG: hypothetical protein ACI8U4_000458 [Natronomonas sp.]|jgi:hypothetical protein
METETPEQGPSTSAAIHHYLGTEETLLRDRLRWAPEVST